jgi:hypothetical protein
MAQTPNRNAPEQRLRFLRFGLIVVVAMAFTIRTTISLFSQAGDMGAALVQGLIWGVGTAVVAVIVYVVYQKVVVKQ